MRMWLVLACFSVSVCAVRSITINKCCGPDFSLGPSFKCTHRAGEHLHPAITLPTLCTANNSSWLPAWAGRLNSTIQYMTRVPCEGQHHLLPADSNNTLEDGSLFVYQGGSAINLTLPSSSYCVDNMVLNETPAVQVIVLCPCSNVTCIKKCCPSNEHLNNSYRCIENEHDINWQPSFIGKTPEHFQLFGRPRCNKEGVYLLNPTSESPIHFWFLEDGRVVGRGFRDPVPLEEYCWDTTRGKDGAHIPNVLYCKKWHQEITATDRRVIIYGIVLLIDAVFLIATLLFYMLLAELRAGLHAKYLMSHTASLLVACLFLGLGQIMPKLGPALCIAIAFIIQFAFLAAFFWLNVMCIDIAWAFSGLRPPQGSAIERDHKKLLFYSAYAWGTTGIISIVTAMVEFIPGLLPLNSPLKPNIGRRACWFEKPAATLAYFYGPMAFLLLGNLMLFLYTAAKIISVRRDTAILNSTGNTSGSAVQKDRQRLVLYLKLFCLMGLTWVTEIISFAVGGADYYWYITDIVNMLRAVFIFAIFCCKKSVLHLLRARLVSILPCTRKLARGKSTISFSAQTSSLQLTTSIKKSSRRPSMET